MSIDTDGSGKIDYTGNLSKFIQRIFGCDYGKELIYEGRKIINGLLDARFRWERKNIKGRIKDSFRK